MSTRAISSTNVVLNDTLTPATIIFSLESGTILEVINEILQNDDPLLKLYDVDPKNYRNLSPLYILPGLVDAHVHLNEPGRTEWEGFETGTKSAVSGGVTTVIDMPLNAIPPTTTLKNFNIKLDAAKGQLWCDVGFWGGLVPDNLNDLIPLINAGVRGFKGFLIDSGVDEFPAIDQGYIDEALKVVEGNDTLIMFHAEIQKDEDFGIDGHEECCAQDRHHATPLEEASRKQHQLEKDDRTHYSSFLASRPDSFEVEAIKTIIESAKKTPSVPMHIVHLASKDAVPILLEAQEEGLKITAETCFHYLTFSAEAIPNGSTYYKCCPPIRTNENRLELWDALKKNIITSVVSDHSPCTPNLKKLGKGDFFSAWGGIASVGLGLPVLFNESLKRGDVSILDIVKWTCVNTAKQVGLSHKKGSIGVGFDADLVIFDPLAKQTIANEGVFFKNKLTAYDGKELQGVVLETILRGNSVFAYDQGFSDVALGVTILEKRASHSAV